MRRSPKLPARATREVWLITPPVEPRPKATEEGPFSTSIDSRKNGSRVYWPRSRIPSMKKSPRAEKPRRVRLSPENPPSPAASEMPVTLRSASCTVLAARSSITSRGTTVTDCGVSAMVVGSRTIGWLSRR